jgi:hypothetical protein
VSYIVGREANTTYNESLNGNTGGQHGNQFGNVVDPFYPNGSLVPLMSPPPYGEPGEADSRVQAYNFRLCVTTDPNNTVPFVKPADYDPDEWELLRRHVAANAVGGGGAPSCNTAPVPNSKYDMNNCGAVSSDMIGESWAYPEADYEKRKEIWATHKAYVQGLLWTLANDPAIQGTVDSAWGLCKDEFPDSGHFPPALYVRAARRLRGPQIFTQNTPKIQAAAGPLLNQSWGLGCYNFDSVSVARGGALPRWTLHVTMCRLLVDVTCRSPLLKNPTPLSPHTGSTTHKGWRANQNPTATFTARRTQATCPTRGTKATFRSRPVGMKFLGG